MADLREIELREQAQSWTNQLVERVYLFGFLGGAASPEFQRLVNSAVENFLALIQNEKGEIPDDIARVSIEHSFILQANEQLKDVWPDDKDDPVQEDDQKEMAATLGRHVEEAMKPKGDVDPLSVLDVTRWVRRMNQAGALAVVRDSKIAQRTLLLLLAAGLAGLDQRLKAHRSSIQDCLLRLLPVHRG